MIDRVRVFRYYLFDIWVSLLFVFFCLVSACVCYCLFCSFCVVVVLVCCTLIVMCCLVLFCLVVYLFLCLFVLEGVCVCSFLPVVARV